MDCKDAVLEGFRKSLVIRGCDTRAQFWWFALVSFPLLCVGPLFVLMFVGSVVPESGFWATVTLVLVFVSYVVLAVPFVTALIRRLHDVGKPGYLWILWFIPGANLYLLYLLAKKGVGKKAN
ncbi:MAG: DUF805 domain-containing protein [Desulfovibrio sp.]|nr:DUF805 domain-containing protein [Desulfovibrio sp.]